MGFVAWKYCLGVPSNLENHFLWSKTIFMNFYGRFGFSWWVNKILVFLAWLERKTFYTSVFIVSTLIFIIFMANSEIIPGNSTKKSFLLGASTQHFGPRFGQLSVLMSNSCWIAFKLYPLHTGNDSMLQKLMDPIFTTTISGGPSQFSFGTGRR